VERIVAGAGIFLETQSGGGGQSGFPKIEQGQQQLASGKVLQLNFGNCTCTFMLLQPFVHIAYIQELKELCGSSPGECLLNLYVALRTQSRKTVSLPVIFCTYIHV
jgi:hypothetical protein